MQTFKSLASTTISAPSPQYKTRSYYLQKILGEGTEGAVYLAEQKNGDPQVQQIALKIQQNIQEHERIFIENLIQYQNKYENPQSQYFPSFIIRIYEIFNWDGKVVITMEVGKENLYDAIKNKRFSNLIEKGAVCIEISKSIQMLHFFGYAHRDIKPENFILVGNDWKLCDFGLTKQNDILVTKNIGTIYYTAPEVLQENYQSYSEKIDIWSLGCVFYELLEGKELFPGNNAEEIKELILTSNKTKKIGDKSLTYIQDKLNELKVADVWRKTLFNMLQYEPSKRIPMQDIINTIVPIRIVEISEKLNSQKEIRKEIPVGAKVFLNPGQSQQISQNIPSPKKPIQPEPVKKNNDQKHILQQIINPQGTLQMKEEKQNKPELQQPSGVQSIILFTNNQPQINQNTKNQSPPKQDPKINHWEKQNPENSKKIENSEQNLLLATDKPKQVTPLIEQIKPISNFNPLQGNPQNNQSQDLIKDPKQTPQNKNTSDEQQQQKNQNQQSSNSFGHINLITKPKQEEQTSDQLRISELEQKLERLEGIVNKLVIQISEPMTQNIQKGLSNCLPLLKENVDQVNETIKLYIDQQKSRTNLEEDYKQSLQTLYENLSCFLKKC